MSSPRRVAVAPVKPLLIFDGDCGFCRRWIARWKSATGESVDYAASQDVGERFSEISKDAFARSVQLVTKEGDVFEGAEAVFRVLAMSGSSWLLDAYEHVPGFRAVAEAAYALVAGHRQFASALTGALWGKRVERPTFRLANAAFVRVLGVCYLAAFVSLWLQIDGLIGSHGILPARNLLAAVRSELGGARWDLLPTLCWLDGSDRFLHVLCGGGTAAAVLVVLGILPVPALAICWAFYLSLVVAGQEFLQFQWDALLLETGFLAIFFAPLRRARVGAGFEAPASMRWLLLWLLFRLMFSSGYVKLASGDPSWRNLTALTYHYWTQPLPPWTAWYMAQHPVGFLKFCCLVMFVVELGAPFFIPAPRRLRLLACGAMAGLQIVIAATGNYAFFNLLTIALCLLLVDDVSFPRRWRERSGADVGASHGRWPKWVVAPVAAAALLASTIAFTGTLRLRVPWPGFVLSWARAGLPFRSINTYGLFMVMTTSRPEIVLEGSDDGVEWRAYEFRWKPGDVTRRPRFVAPHQPRLDWQMWFAALGSYSENPWFLEFCARLLEGRKEVTALLKFDPFPEAPPHYLRAVVYDYRFTTSAERRATGAWWKRERRGLYLPVLSREMLRPER